MLVLNNICKRYGDKIILQGLDCCCNTPELVTFLGPSGAGKSTVLKIIAGLVPQDRGTVVLDGVELSKTPPEKRGIVYISQEPSLFTHLSVKENICFGLKMRRTSRQKMQAKLATLLEVLELKGLENRKVWQLSGGQRQRVALGRGLAVEPRVLLMDEPFSSLDVTLRNTLGMLIKKIRETFPITMLMVTHDPKEALALSDQIVLIDQGKILQKGAPDQVYRNPETPDAAHRLGPWGTLPGQWEDEGFRCDIGNFRAKNPVVFGNQLFYRPDDIVLMPRPGGFKIEKVWQEGTTISYGISVHNECVKLVTSDSMPMAVGTEVKVFWRKVSE